MDTAQWPQEIVVKPIEEIVTNTCPKPAAATGLDQRKVRPQKDQALNCPRCNSTNTKFCYYNNYSLTQPRYFCKTCRRYWTEGGSLRNIPVGGGSRKNKRSSISSNSSSSSSAASFSNSSSSKKLPDLITPSSSTTPPPPPPPPPTHHHRHHQNPNKIHDGQDLNLAFPSFTTAVTTTTSGQLSALELLTGISSRGLNSFMPNLPVEDPNSVYTSGFPLQDFKPTLSFSLDGIGSGYGSLHGVQESSSGRLLFPFEDLKQVSSTVTTTDIHQNREHGDTAGYWTGMLGGGGGGGGGSW